MLRDFFESGRETLFQIIWTSMILGIATLVLSLSFGYFQRLSPTWQDRSDTVAVTCFAVVVGGLLAGAIFRKLERTVLQAAENISPRPIEFERVPSKEPNITCDRTTVEEPPSIRSASRIESIAPGSAISLSAVALVMSPSDAAILAWGRFRRQAAQRYARARSR